MDGQSMHQLSASSVSDTPPIEPRKRTGVDYGNYQASRRDLAYPGQAARL
jgi:hypothetical protein